MTTSTVPPPAGPRHSAAPLLRQSFVVQNERGLHARPCAQLIRTLQPFRCHVTAEARGEKADARSLIGLLMLGAGFGASVTFTARGDDAAPALAALQHFFATGFQAAYAPVADRSPGRPVDRAHASHS
jgi:phosphotransferase system HPr (HPr) family protein